jgi:enamine deaminase RidA (YjgF/YER057c/UK114 family)
VFDLLNSKAPSNGFYSHDVYRALSFSLFSPFTPRMKFLLTSSTFPFSAAVIHSGKTLETVLTAIPPGESKPVAGGAGAEMREIFRQLDHVLELAGLTKLSIVSVRLYLQDVLRDIAEVNQVYKEYFGSHPPNRRAYGVTLQAGMLVEAAFVAEVEAEPGA